MNNIGKWVLAAGVACFLLSAMPAMSGDRQVMILADVSGSMQEKFTYKEKKENSDEEQEKTIRKIEALKTLLLDLSAKPELFDSPLGVYRFRHIAGYADDWEIFMEPGVYESGKFADEIRDGFETEYPVFNRRTPLADALKQIQENVLKNVGGEVILVILTDGKDSFYDLKKDAKKSLEAAEKDEMEGPLSETVRITRTHGDRLTIHTVYMEEGEEPYGKDQIEAFFGKDETEMDREVNGEMLLKRMARAGGGMSFSAKQLLEDQTLRQTFLTTLCGSE